MIDPFQTPPSLPAVRVTRVSAFDDNYLWLIHGRFGAEGRVVAVDPGDSDAIIEVLGAEELTLAAVLVTHHHGDHIGGVPTLAIRYSVPVYGPAREAIPARSHALSDGDVVEFTEMALKFRVIALPGHTAGHIAYSVEGAVFCGDTLFSGGCGRLLEGSPAQMLASLETLAALPDTTAVYCAHEYTAANLRFALNVEPGNMDLKAYAERVAATRAQGGATVPTTIGLERAINPFLRSRLPTVRDAAARHAGRPARDAAEAFGQLREWKDGFRG